MKNRHFIQLNYALPPSRQVRTSFSLLFFGKRFQIIGKTYSFSVFFPILGFFFPCFVIPFSWWPGQAGWEAAGPRGLGDGDSCRGLSGRQAVPAGAVWAAGGSSANPHAWLFRHSFLLRGCPKRPLSLPSFSFTSALLQTLSRRWSVGWKPSLRGSEVPRRNPSWSFTCWPWGTRHSPKPSPPSWTTPRRVPPLSPLRLFLPCGDSLLGTSPARYEMKLPRFGASLPVQSQAVRVQREPPFAHHRPNSTIFIALLHQVKRAMRRIFHEQRKSYEKTCRLAAAEMLLDNEPLPMDVINILLATIEMETETATFLLLKVQNSLRGDHHPARWIRKGQLHFFP